MSFMRFPSRLRGDAIALSEIRHVDFERILPDGRRGSIVLESNDQTTFSMSKKEFSDLLNAVGRGQSARVRLPGKASLRVSGDYTLFASDAGEPATVDITDAEGGTWRVKG